MHKKVIRGVLVCLSFYGFGELMYQVGKGRMLGIISHYSDVPLDELKPILSDMQKKYPANVIWSVCKFTEETMDKKES